MRFRTPRILCVAVLLSLPALQAGAVPPRFPDLAPTPRPSPLPERYVPAADLIHALSSSWEWDPLLGRLKLILPNHERLILLVDSGLVRLEDQLFRLEDPVRFINDRLMVPKSLITDVLEPALGRLIELPTPTPEPTPFLPVLSPTPVIDFGPLPWSPASRETVDLEPAESSQPADRAIGQRPVVVLDPGHGGEDKGSVGVGSTTEAELVLRIAQLCEESLEADFDIDVLLTRREDRDLTTVERITFANDLNAQVFISLHAGGLFDPEGNIPSVFFLASPASEGLSGRGVSQVRWWDQPSVQPLFVRWQLGSAAWSKESRDLARNLRDALLTAYGDIQAGGFEDGPRPARLADLRGLLMPAALVELGSFSSLETEQILNPKGFQRRLAESLAVAIGNWIYRQEGLSPRDMLFP